MEHARLLAAVRGRHGLARDGVADAAEEAVLLLAGGGALPLPGVLVKLVEVDPEGLERPPHLVQLRLDLLLLRAGGPAAAALPPHRRQRARRGRLALGHGVAVQQGLLGVV